MWLRLALKLLAAISILSACSPADRHSVDKLNSLSYACHYRSLDSTEHYARQAYQQSAGYADGRAEALNNIAFVSILRMQYDEAHRQLDSVADITYNQVELLIADVQHMRLCQRRSDNRQFYDYFEQAQRRLQRINEERADLSDHLAQRLRYAESEMAIVNSTYFYYVGLEQQSVEALHHMPETLAADTAQWLNYLYNQGVGGIRPEGTRQDIVQQEFDCLVRCYQIARAKGYPFFEANALEAIADLLKYPAQRQHLLERNEPAIELLNTDEVAPEQLPLKLADKALCLFTSFGDVYQKAGAYRTLASCYHAMGDDQSALTNLQLALADSTILEAPDLVASIHEQLSVVYSALDIKPKSDEHRNLYLDLQEETRQDRYLEARASQLEHTVGRLNIMLVAVGVAIVLLLFLLWLFNHLSRRQKYGVELDEQLEELSDQLAMARLHVESSERQHLEQRAKISLVNSITPFIDRIIHEIKREDHLDYPLELTEQIIAYNDVLTHWIQLRQGELSLHVESFPLQPLFDVVSRARTGFTLKGVDLDVVPTGAVVKADRVLTLFMINTLADNARKFTPQGGKVCIEAQEAPDYVEIAVSDTGEGMDEEQLAHLFDHKIVENKVQNSHGFGLLNCKGIIEKYRKTSRLFNVCTIEAQSEKGRGTRLFFRLPKGVARFLVFGLWLLAFGQPLYANRQEPAARAAHIDARYSENSLLPAAKIYADSAYFSNINGNYERTLLFADSARQCLNQHYLLQHPNGRRLMLREADNAAVAPEIVWWRDSVDTNYDIILDLRNESAVAALALHRWSLYNYTNSIYTQLFKEISADRQLDDYCRRMQKSQTDKTVAIVLLVLAFLAILPAYYLLYYRRRLYARISTVQEKKEQLEQMADELRRMQLESDKLHVANAVLDNCLSALKHETMYYPSRIRVLLQSKQLQPLAETVAYYRELYDQLSQQAMRQVEHVKLHLKTLDHEILGDENLVRYLFEILRKQTGQKKLDVSYMVRDEKYVSCNVTMPGLQLSDSQLQNLFSPSIDNIPYLLCRQIVRDHGEATNRRACGISAKKDNGTIYINIILPRSCKHSK